MESKLQFGSVQLPKCATSVNTFIKNRHTSSVIQKKNDWLRGLGDTWISDFVTCGLIPFLQSHGYRIGYSHSKIVAYCMNWGFAHVQAKGISPSATVRCMQTYHAGGEAELDWYLFHISYDDWCELFNEWHTSQFLDDSDAGSAQQADFPFFVWNLLDLSASRMHTKFLQAMYDEYPDEEEFGFFQANDESSAFGGDRRTL
jgi:hypothetical protein